MNKLITLDGLSHFKDKMIALFDTKLDGKVNVDGDKVLSDENYTSDEKAKRESFDTADKYALKTDLIEAPTPATNEEIDELFSEVTD